MTDTTSIDNIIRILNEALAAEPEAVHNIFKYYPCDTHLSDHPTIQVFQGPTLSAMGIINGFFDTHSNGYGQLCKVCEDTAEGEPEVILRFERFKPPSD